MIKLSAYAAVALVIAWRISAFLHPHPMISDPVIVSRVLAAMGLWFLACTLWAYVHRPNRSTTLLLAYGLCTAIHWGGPVKFDYLSDTIVIAFYLVFSSVVAQCIFLHLAVVGSTGRRLVKLTHFVVYVPSVAALLLLVFQIARPESKLMLSYFMALSTVAGVLSLVGAGFWVYGWARAAGGSTLRHRKGLVVLALLGWIPSIVVMTGLVAWSGLEGLLNLTLAFEPAALAWFFVHPGVQPKKSPGHDP